MVLPGDRRAHPRQPCLIKCAFVHNEQIHQARILNFCDAGVFVASTAKVHEGDTLLLRMKRLSDNQTVEVRAMVIHLVKRGEGQPGFGVQLFELLSTLAVAEGRPDSFPELPRDVLLSRAGRLTGEPDEEASAEGGSTAAGAAPSPEPTSKRIKIRARESRHVHKVGVRYALRAGARTPREGQIVNVSRGGLYLGTAQVVAPNTLITVWFDGTDVDGGKEDLEVLAQVVWTSAERCDGELPDGLGCRVLGFNPDEHRKRWERLLRDLLVIGNPLFRAT